MRKRSALARKLNLPRGMFNAENLTPTGALRFPPSARPWASDCVLALSARDDFHFMKRSSTLRCPPREAA